MGWRYDGTDFIAKYQPAIYFLSLNGVRYLRELGKYPDEELRKRYKEPTRTQVFIDRCLLIADCCIALQAKNSGRLKYTCVLPPDYINPDSDYHFLDELKPQLYFSKRDGDDTTGYILENYELTLPRYLLRKRIKDYVEYLSDRSNEELIALFICATTADLLYVKRCARKVIDEEYYVEELKVCVTTLDKIRSSGMTVPIWEEIS